MTQIIRACISHMSILILEIDAIQDTCSVANVKWLLYVCRLYEERKLIMSNYLIQGSGQPLSIAIAHVVCTIPSFVK